MLDDFYIYADGHWSIFDDDDSISNEYDLELM